MLSKLHTKKQKLGFIIQHERKKQGMNQGALGKALIYDQSIISRIEKGYKNINDDLYDIVLKYFKIKHEENTFLEKQIEDIIDNIYSSYEVLNIDHFRQYIFQIEEFLHLNQNIIFHYNLLMLKMICLYMLQQEKAKTYLDTLETYYPILHPKCQALFQMIQIQYYLRDNKRLDLSQELKTISLSKENDDGLVLYLWGKYYFTIFDYSKALDYYSKALNHFMEEKNYQRIVRCGTNINEILLVDYQYDIVKERIEKLLHLKPYMTDYDYRYLNFQLAYCLYHLKSYQEAYEVFDKIVKSSKALFIEHMYHKCLYQLKVKPIEAVVFHHNYYDELYFELENEKPAKYYQLIEEHILPRIGKLFYLKEIQHYVFNLLDHYFHHKKYTLYKKLSNKINQIMHI